MKERNFKVTKSVIERNFTFKRLLKSIQLSFSVLPLSQWPVKFTVSNITDCGLKWPGIVKMQLSTEKNHVCFTK